MVNALDTCLYYMNNMSIQLSVVFLINSKSFLKSLDKIMLQIEGRVQAPWVLRKNKNIYERSEVRASGFPRHAHQSLSTYINMFIFQACSSSNSFIVYNSSPSLTQTERKILYKGRSGSYLMEKVGHVPPFRDWRENAW